MKSQGASSASTVAGSTSDPGGWSYQLYNPSSIDIDQYGYIYIVDTTNSRIQKWFPGASYGKTIIPSAIMNNPIGFSLDLYGNYFLADTSNHRIVQYSLICRKFHFLFFI